jgi:hypothetical protein
MTTQIKKKDAKAFLQWAEMFITQVMPSAGDGETSGPYGFSLEFDGKEFTMKAWTMDSFAWSGEATSKELATLADLFDEENG